MHKPESDERWLDPVLTEKLSRVHAPQGLWSRIDAIRQQRRRRNAGQIAWALAAALMVISSLWTLIPQTLAGPSSCDSSDPVLVQAWLKSAAGFDVPLPSVLPAAVKLTGAQHLRSAVLITYRAQNRDIALRIEKSPDHQPNHRFTSPTNWTMRGQSYTLVTLDEARIACALCHADRAI